MNTKIKLLTAGIISAVSLFSLTAQAEEIQWSGFASFKAGTTLSDDKEMEGYGENLEFRNESLLALQARSKISDNLSVTAQLMARGSNDFDLEMEWAYMTYMLSGNTSVNIGRQRAPLYQYSDFLDLGFAYDWVRAPQVVYDLGYNSFDGASLNHRFDLGDWQMDARFMFGRNDNSEGEVINNVDNMYGGSLSGRKDAFEFRVSRFQGDITFATDDLTTLGQTLIGAGLTDLGSNFIIEENDGVFTGLSLNYDDGSHIINAEMINAEAKQSMIPEINTYYISYGYRMESMTPYFVYENRENKPKLELLEGVPVNPLTPIVQGALIGAAQKEDVYSVGFRKNLTPKMAFKTQFSYERDRLNNEYNQLASVSIDLIF